MEIKYDRKLRVYSMSWFGVYLPDLGLLSWLRIGEHHVRYLLRVVVCVILHACCIPLLHACRRAQIRGFVVPDQGSGQGSQGASPSLNLNPNLNPE